MNSAIVIYAEFSVFLFIAVAGYGVTFAIKYRALRREGYSPRMAWKYTTEALR